MNVVRINRQISELVSIDKGPIGPIYEWKLTEHFGSGNASASTTHAKPPPFSMNNFLYDRFPLGEWAIANSCQNHSTLNAKIRTWIPKSCERVCALCVCVPMPNADDGERRPSSVRRAKWSFASWNSPSCRYILCEYMSMD